MTSLSTTSLPVITDPSPAAVKHYKTKTTTRHTDYSDGQVWQPSNSIQFNQKTLPLFMKHLVRFGRPEYDVDKLLPHSPPSKFDKRYQSTQPTSYQGFVRDSNEYMLSDKTIIRRGKYLNALQRYERPLADLEVAGMPQPSHVVNSDKLLKEKGDFYRS